MSLESSVHTTITNKFSGFDVLFLRMTQDDDFELDNQFIQKKCH